MISFPEQPDMRPVVDGYKLMEDYYYSGVTIKNHYIRILIPKGYISDGASVPRIVWTLSGLTPDGLIRAAALVHDYLYENKGKIDFKAPNANYLYELSKRECDNLFKDIMIKSGVSKYRANTAFYAVKAFGWTYWARNKYPIVFNQ